AINAIGNAGNNIIIGNNLANFIIGGAGADNMNGKGGDDSYLVDNPGDVVAEDDNNTLWLDFNHNLTVDTGEIFTNVDLVTSSVSFALSANIENLTLAGSAGINGTGNDLRNFITGNAGANVLDGGTDADTMKGGGGDDTYVVDNPNDVLVEAADAGIDTVRSSISFVLQRNFENLTLTGSANLGGTGNTVDNIIRGNDGANTLDGK